MEDVIKILDGESKRSRGILFCQLEHELKAIGKVIEHKIDDQGSIEKTK